SSTGSSPVGTDCPLPSTSSPAWHRGALMRSADKLRLRLRSLFLRSRVEAEMAAEISFHIDQLTAENVAAGMSFRAARHAALRAFGSVTQIEERCREMRGTKWIEDLG